MIHRMGRETLYNEDRHKRICDTLRIGNYRECAARCAGITPRTLNRWIADGKKGKEPFASLLSDVLKAEEEAEARDIALIDKVANGEWIETEETTVTYSKDGSTVTTTKRKYGRPEWTAAAWKRERKNPDRWSKDTDLLREMKREHLRRLKEAKVTETDTVLEPK